LVLFQYEFIIYINDYREQLSFDPFVELRVLLFLFNVWRVSNLESKFCLSNSSTVFGCW